MRLFTARLHIHFNNFFGHALQHVSTSYEAETIVGDHVYANYYICFHKPKERKVGIWMEDPLNICYCQRSLEL